MPKAKNSTSKHGNISSTPASHGSCKAGSAEQPPISSSADSFVPDPRLPNKGRNIEITAKNYRSLKSTYDCATVCGAPDFIWQDNVILTAYAKYMLEHMRNVLGIKE